MFKMSVYSVKYKTSFKIIFSLIEDIALDECVSKHTPCLFDLGFSKYKDQQVRENVSQLNIKIP